MTMKMFNKSECEYKGGYIVNDGKVVCVDNEVVDLLNKLDTDVQRAQHEATLRPDCCSALIEEEFVPKSEHSALCPMISVNTPEMDKMTEQAMKIMDEADAMIDANKANEYIEGIQPLFFFVNDDFIVSCENGMQHRFDLPTVGNPLELTKEKLSDLVISMFDLHV